MALVSTMYRSCALFLLAVALAVPPAWADPVTHQFTGQLTTITDGSNNSLDLTGVFTPGQAVTLDYTIERSTTPVQVDAYTSSYTDAITALAFFVGGWSGSGTPAYSFTTVLNNVPSGPVNYDQYSGQVQGGIAAPPIGGSDLQSMTWTFDDVQGTVFGSTEIPGPFPDLGAFEGKTLTILLFNFTHLKAGYVMATLAGVTTPAKPTTWGAMKGLYR